jgi:hypothetical protein
MNTRSAKFLGITFLMIALVAPLCMGMGFGVYGSYDVLLNMSGYFQSVPDFQRIKFGQYGILFDTNMAKNTMFNYRLNLGVDLSQVNFTDSGTPVTMDIWKIMFNNTFGFGMMRSQMMRLWVGPQVGFGIGFERTMPTASYYVSNNGFIEMDFYAGFAVGLNIHLMDSLSLCGDLGMRMHEAFMYSRGGSFSGFLIDGNASVALVLKADDMFEPLKPAPASAE